MKPPDKIYVSAYVPGDGCYLVWIDNNKSHAANNIEYRRVDEDSQHISVSVLLTDVVTFINIGLDRREILEKIKSKYTIIRNK